MTNQRLSIVDVETTGLDARIDRIIELAIIRVEDGQVVERFSQLINPGVTVSPFITGHTGITNQMLSRAPSFADAAPKFEHLLDNGLFIAHNAGFDFSFLKEEYRRLGRIFALPRQCTAQLSRQLFPGYRRHGLDHIISRFKLDCPRRHRALDDAEATWQFYSLVMRLTDNTDAA